MQLTRRALAIVAAVVAGVRTQELQIHAPTSVVQCEPTQLTFSGGRPPYYISILPGGQPGAAALETLPATSGTSLTWLVDISGGTAITFGIRDNAGQTDLSPIVVVRNSMDSSCLG